MFNIDIEKIKVIMEKYFSRTGDVRPGYNSDSCSSLKQNRHTNNRRIGDYL